MITCFVQLNLKLLFVLILLGFIIGKSRHSAIQNFSNKKCGYFIMDFFNLIGIPVHELGHLLFGLFFGYHIDQVCLYRTTKKAIHSGGTLWFIKMHHENHSFLQKTAGRFRTVFYRDRSTLVWTDRYLYYQPVSPGKYQNTPFFLPKRMGNFPESLATITSFWYNLSVCIPVYHYGNFFKYGIKQTGYASCLQRPDSSWGYISYSFRSFCFISLESAI